MLHFRLRLHRRRQRRIQIGSPITLPFRRCRRRGTAARAAASAPFTFVATTTTATGLPAESPPPKVGVAAVPSTVASEGFSTTMSPGFRSLDDLDLLAIVAPYLYTGKMYLVIAADRPQEVFRDCR